MNISNSNNKTIFQDYGCGVGLRSSHYSTFLSQKPKSVDWVEVVSENYLNWSDGTASQILSTLEKVRGLLPVALHGVSMNLGSSDPLNFNYLKNLKDLVHNINPMWVSDHLCWTGVDGKNAHDLLPLPYTEETIKHLVEKISRVQDFLGQRILIENLSSYIEFTHSEMPEWSFLSEIATRADCGILLDVNNVFVSSFNHGFDPLEYLLAMPAERIGQIHLAGHSVRDGFLFDTHDEPVSDDVWNLYSEATELFEKRSVMIERDDKIPEWEVLEKEVLHAKRIRDGHSSTDIKQPDDQQPNSSSERVPELTI